MSISLTTGCMLSIWQDPQNYQQGDHPNEDPLVQVLNVKEVSSAEPKRYRFIISDGVHYMQAMLATQLNEIVPTIKKNCIIKLRHYICNNVSNKRIMIILKAEVMTPFVETTPKYGAPVPLGMGDAANAAPAAAAATTPVQNTYSAPGQQGQQQQQQQPQQQQQGAYNGQQNQYGNQNASGWGNQQPNGYSGNNSNASSNMPPRGAGEVPSAIFPIKSLSPYQNKWTIKARVLSKSDIRHWDNARGRGKLFSCTFVDESGEIRATAFNDGVDNFYDALVEGKVYYVSKAQIKVAKKQFSNVQNEYEMSIDPTSQISECFDTADVPNVRYNFVELNKLGELDVDAVIDVVVVVKECGEVAELISKNTQKPYKKRDLTVVDHTGWEVRTTLWGKSAETFEHRDNPVLAIKGIKVGDFQGRTLSTLGTSSISINPDITESHHLRGWFDEQGRNASFQSYSNSSPGGIGSSRDPVICVSAIKEQNLGLGEKPDYFMLRGTIIFIRSENPSYPACPSDNCNKKVVETDNGWRCEKCDMMYPAPVHRYIMQFNVSDHTGQVWMNGFNDIGEKLFGKTANEIVAMKENGQTEEYDRLFAAPLFQPYIFKCRAKAETYQDEQKVKTSCISFEPVDYASATAQLADQIEALKLRPSH